MDDCDDDDDDDNGGRGGGNITLRQFVGIFTISLTTALCPVSSIVYRI